MMLSPRSSAHAHRWLRIGFRLSLLTLGVCLAAGLYHHWYVWVPVGGLAIFFFAELPLTYRDKL